MLVASTVGARGLINNDEARLLVTKVFKLVEAAESVSDYERIVENDSILQKYKFNTTKYPNLSFELSANDIKNLQVAGILSSENKLQPLTETLGLSPLEKLLYSVVWKNGDIGKEKHIVEGVLSLEDDDSSREHGLVFFQYGKHLTNRAEPIVDQHTMRAFLFYENRDSGDSELTELRKINTINSDDLLRFKSWLKSLQAGGVEHQFHIDKILFALGKAIKIAKKSD